MNAYAPGCNILGNSMGIRGKSEWCDIFADLPVIRFDRIVD